VVEACDSWNVQDIAYDPWNAQGLVNNLIADGVKMVEFRQGYKTMSSPSKELEKLVTAHLLRHNGNPVLRWMALNAVILRDPAGNIKPDKSKATEKIDGIVAGIMALGRAQANPVKPSAYAQRGILTI
jgi:phage terminase large subunit-like protein